jgi:hypothetical protein
MKKKQRIAIDHTLIGCSRQPAGQVEGEQQEGRGRSKGWDAREEPQHHHNMKPEQDDVRAVEWVCEYNTD